MGKSVITLFCVKLPQRPQQNYRDTDDILLLPQLLSAPTKNSQYNCLVGLCCSLHMKSHGQSVLSKSVLHSQTRLLLPL